MTNIQRNDKHAQNILKLSAMQVRDYVLDNRDMFPELDGIGEAELTKRIMNERNLYRETAPTTGLTVIWLVPALLIAGTIITGVLSLFGI